MASTDVNNTRISESEKEQVVVEKETESHESNTTIDKTMKVGKCVEERRSGLL